MIRAAPRFHERMMPVGIEQKDGIVLDRIDEDCEFFRPRSGAVFVRAGEVIGLAAISGAGIIPTAV